MSVIKVTKTRGKKPTLDEVVMYDASTGETPIHIEKMSDKHWWMRISVDNKDVVINFTSKSSISAAVFEHEV